MAHFADLTPCRYFSFDHEGKLLAVGWLDPDFDFHRGDVDPDVVNDLTMMLVNPWQPCACMGWHDCPFCRFSHGPRQFTYNNTTVDLGISNLFIPGDGVLYVAPSLVLHYIDAHGYGVPDVFADAVMDCPPMRSMDYLKLLVKCGPPSLVSAIKDSR